MMRQYKCSSAESFSKRSKQTPEVPAMATASEAFSKHYQSLTDDELLALAAKRQQLGDEALVALDQELLSRGLNQNSLREYEAWVHRGLTEGPGRKEHLAKILEDEAVTPAELSPQTIKAFSQHYRSLTDDELLRLAVDRQELKDEALVARDEELLSRGLNLDALHEYQSRVCPPLSDGQGGTDPGQEEVQQAAASAELPADWFDIEADTSAPTLVYSRPKGVTVAALLFWAWGLIDFALGIGALLKSEGGIEPMMVGLILSGWGAVLFVTGSELWRLKERGRITAEVLCWISLVINVAGITLSARARLQGYEIDLVTAFSDVGESLFNILWIVYFGRSDVRGAFAKAASSND